MSGRALRAMIAAALLLGCGRIGFDTIASTGDDGGPDASLGGFSRVAAYGDYTCAELRGNLHCWGENARGQLGDGTTAPRSEPRHTLLPEGTLGAFAQGEAHACAIVGGTLHCWGAGFATTPAPVSLGAPPTDLAAGNGFTCVLVAGIPQCFGSNGNGQLGDDTMVPHVNPMPVMGGAIFTSLDGGDDHVCGLTAGGAMCWGHNDDGALGTGSFTPANSLAPTAVLATVTTIPRIAGWHSCALTNGTVQCWGRNMEGALGDATQTRTATPQLVPNLTNVTAIATGGGPADFDATCAVSNGDVYCWGAGGGGRLGTGNDNNSLVPVRVTGLPTTAVDVALGYAHACALLADEHIWCWGRGDKGQLGNGASTSSFAPAQVTVRSGDGLTLRNLRILQNLASV